jgi:hypothetical protein
MFLVVPSLVPLPATAENQLLSGCGCGSVLADYFLEIPHNKSINSPFTIKPILKFPKYLKETWLKIPHF